MAYKPKAQDVMASPNIIPMADIMLVLLIIFMVVTPMIQKGASVERATVDNPKDMQDAEKEDALVVAVTRDGSIFLGSQKIDQAMITATLKERLSARTDKTVFLNSDRAAKYGRVVAVVDEIRAAGVDQLGLLTEKNEKKGAAHAAPTGGQ
ncbi:MAG TPA: biopolymer transporter ExbD [Candidatus Acidoferrales bacterium]|nr:biopolymer transporter ExbD [Candidatus Acidoferrales bacterium]